MTSLKNKQDELEELREHKLRGALIRARWQQLTEGEKPTKYVLNLENRNFISKHIREIKVNSKSIIKPMEILDEMKNFYETLYKQRETVDIENTNYAQIANNLTKLTDTEKQFIEREISLEDLKYIVFKSKNNKSPGPDGFSNEFYKIFWEQIKLLLLKLMILYRHTGKLKVLSMGGL